MNFWIWLPNKEEFFLAFLFLQFCHHLAHLLFLTQAVAGEKIFLVAAVAAAFVKIKTDITKNRGQSKIKKQTYKIF